MGISQNFNKNLKKAVKGQMPILPAGDKFIFQQLVKNIDEVEDMLEGKVERKRSSEKGYYCRCPDLSLCHSTDASCYGQCCVGDPVSAMVSEYNVGDLKKVIRNLSEAKKCTYSFECKGGKICLKGRCKKNPHEKIVSPGTNYSSKNINKNELKEKEELHERKWCSKRKLGKPCDGGDGHKQGVWSNTVGGCKCQYGGSTPDWMVRPDGPEIPDGVRDLGGKRPLKPQAKTSGQWWRCVGGQCKQAGVGGHYPTREACENSPHCGKKSNELEVGEATSTASSGAYSTPRFWSKDKKNQRFSTQRWMPGAKYVKVKEKCKKFPYCNQGDINALEIWEKEIMRESAKNVSKKTGKSESEVREMIENELAEIIRRGLYKSPIKDLVGNKKMNTPIGKIFTMSGNKPKYEK